MGPPQYKRARKRTLSIALICRSYPPVVGGSEVEAQQLAVELIRRGHDVQVITAAERGRDGGLTQDAYRVPVQSIGGALTGRWLDYSFALGVARTLGASRRRFDVAYFLMPGIHLALGLPVARLLGKGVVVKFSGGNEIRKLTHSVLGRVVLALLGRCADRIVVLNAAMSAEAQEAGLPQKPVLLPNPVDCIGFRPPQPEDRSAIRVKLELPADAFAVTFVGRLAPEKNLPVLIEAFRSLVDSHPGAMLILVGDGPDRDSLAELIESYDLGGRVRITGFQEREAVREWLQASDVFALVSRVEGLPVSLIEAMAVGLPSLVSDIPGNTVVVTDGLQGIVAELGNARATAQALSKLREDAGLRSRLGSAARQEAVKRFSADVVVAAYEELLRDVAFGENAA